MSGVASLNSTTLNNKPVLQAPTLGNRMPPVVGPPTTANTPMTSRVVTASIPNQLFHAVQTGDLATLRRLVTASNVNTTNAHGNTLLHEAVSSGFTDIVNFLLKERNANPNLINNKGEAALHWAAIGGKNSEEILSTLLSRGANINIQTQKEGWTPLHIAAGKGHLNLVEMLVSRGADIRLLSFSGSNALNLAMHYSHSNTARFLYSKGLRNNSANDHPVGQMRRLAGAWGIPGSVTIGGHQFERDSGSEIRHPLLSMGDALEQYTTTQNSPNQIPIPAEIISAFRTAPDNILTPPAEIAKRIQQGELVVLRSGWKGHEVDVVFYQGYMVICNRGEGAKGDGDVCFLKAFKVNLKSVTPDLIQKIQTTPSLAKKDSREFLKQLPIALSAKEDDVTMFMDNISMKQQKDGFCPYNSAEASLLAITSLQTMLHVTKDQPTLYYRATQGAHQQYKHCTTFFRLQFLNDYLTRIENGTLPKEYIDVELLREIRIRLSSSAWHPERFTNPFFANMKTQSLSRLSHVLATLR